MELSLHVVWKVVPGVIERTASETEGGLDIVSRWGFLYTVATSVSLASAAGVGIKYLGFPGDLPNVIHCVHKLGYVPMEQTLPMIFVSLFSIAAGGSLGPSAPACFLVISKLKLEAGHLPRNGDLCGHRSDLQQTSVPSPLDGSSIFSSPRRSLPAAG